MGCPHLHRTALRWHPRSSALDCWVAFLESSGSGHCFTSFESLQPILRGWFSALCPRQRPLPQTRSSLLAVRVEGSDRFSKSPRSKDEPMPRGSPSKFATTSSSRLGTSRCYGPRYNYSFCVVLLLFGFLFVVCWFFPFFLPSFSFFFFFNFISKETVASHSTQGAAEECSPKPHLHPRNPGQVGFKMPVRLGYRFPLTAAGQM